VIGDQVLGNQVSITDHRLLVGDYSYISILITEPFFPSAVSKKALWPIAYKAYGEQDA